MADLIDVLIVGGGPVGMALAIDLGQRGIACTVIERYKTPQLVPKGQNLTQRTGEHFKAWGVSEQIRAACPIPHEFGIAGLTTYGSLLSGYQYDWYVRSEVRQFYAADDERLPQYATENVLRARAAELENVKTIYGWKAEKVVQDDSAATVTLSEREGDGIQQLRARYVIGCDGSNSVVRDSLQFEQDIDPHDKRMVLLVFQSVELHELLERFPGKCYFNALSPDLDGYWLFFGRVEMGKSWFFHAPVPADTTLENFDFQAYLHRSVGAEFKIEFDHIGFWDLRIAVAKNYRQKRVLIAGDAAHSHPPYGGYGINTGFEDVRNLGWKLSAVLKGWGGKHLLDAYSAERQPVFASTANDFIARMIRDDREFLSKYNPEKDQVAFEAAWHDRSRGSNADVVYFVPNYEGSPIVHGEIDAVSSAKGQHEFIARAGHHLAPQPLSAGGTTFEALGDGFTLLAFDTEASLTELFQSVAADLKVPLTIIEDSYDSGREKYGASAILVRPDHFIAWVGGDDPEVDVAAILNRAIGAA